MNIKLIKRNTNMDRKKLSLRIESNNDSVCNRNINCLTMHKLKKMVIISLTLDKTKIMNKIFLILTIFLGFTLNSFSQDLSQPKGGGTLDIVLISPDDGYSIMNFEGQISGYGSVFVKFKVSSINTSKTSGTLDGQARTILEDGTLITSPVKGTWKRNGELMKFYFTDAINNGAMNFVMWDVKLLEKKAEVKYFELHGSDN